MTAMRAATLARPALIVLVATALVGGLTGGLLRAGVAWPALLALPWAGAAVNGHAALMVCGFLGTVIGIERAVAVRLRAAFVAPIASGGAALATLLGHGALGGALFVLAATAFVGVNVVIVRRQVAAHTVLLLVAALAWWVGNVLAAAAGTGEAVIAWWFAFVVLTIAAERLEMTRLMRRHPAAQPVFFAIVGLLLVGAALAILAPRAGSVLYGAALAALAAWLLNFDIARRTVHAHGLSRYMALCLLGGHAWLLVAGAAWIATALGVPARDVALHALGLGFVIAMVMGHAPVILPAVARVKLAFGWPFYLPLALLHASLLWRFAAGATDASARAAGAAANAGAIVLFAATALGAIVAWRRLHPPRALAPR
jgi:hypothetical protein